MNLFLVPVIRSLAAQHLLFLRSLSACLGFFFFGDFVGTLAPRDLLETLLHQRLILTFL